MKNFGDLKYGDLIAECDPMQNPWEVNETLIFLERYEIKTVVEIGMYQGGSFCCWSRGIASQPDHLIGVTRDEVELLPTFREKACRGRHYEPDVDLVFGLSQTPETVAQVHRLLDGAPIDFLFIDGGHSFGEVALDWQIYAPMVRPGGVVAIHDVNPGAQDILRFWESEIKMSHRSVLIADAANRDPDSGLPWGGLGIGLVLR